MKAILVMLAMLSGAPLSSAAAGEDTGAPSKLIEAAKEAKAKRKASTSKPITNKDVKKSKGKLIVLPEKPLPAGEKPDNGLSPMQEQDKRYQARLAAQDQVDEMAKKVSELEKKLEDLEQKYYEASDPNHRDDVIRKAFGETKRELDKARLDLFAAAQTLDGINKP